MAAQTVEVQGTAPLCRGLCTCPEVYAYEGEPMALAFPALGAPGPGKDGDVGSFLLLLHSLTQRLSPGHPGGQPGFLWGWSWGQGFVTAPRRQGGQ